jgi:hypothetical protein
LLIKKRSKITLPEKAAQLVEEKYLKASTVEALKNFLALDLKSREVNASTDYSTLLKSSLLSKSQSEDNDRVLQISKEIDQKHQELIQYFADLIGDALAPLLKDFDVQKFIDGGQPDGSQPDGGQPDGEQTKQGDKQHELLKNPLLGTDSSSSRRSHARGWLPVQGRRCIDSPLHRKKGSSS